MSDPVGRINEKAEWLREVAIPAFKGDLERWDRYIKTPPPWCRTDMSKFFELQAEFALARLVGAEEHLKQLERETFNHGLNR